MSQKKDDPIKNKAQRAAKIKSDVSSIQEEINQSLAEGSAGVKRKAKLKSSIKIALWGIGLLFILWAYNWLFTAKKGGMGFGLCKVFLELQVQYPPELRLSYVRPLSSTMRIWYVQRDAFGQTRFDAMDCKFMKDPERGMILDKVSINRREMDPDIITKFNMSIPAIMAYPPDLTYPQGLPDSIKQLKLSK